MKLVKVKNYEADFHVFYLFKGGFILSRVLWIGIFYRPRQ